MGKQKIGIVKANKAVNLSYFDDTDAYINKHCEDRDVLLGR